MPVKLHLLIRTALAATLLQSPAARAADYFITIGGGYSPEGNQASQEANVLFVQKVLAEGHAAFASHQIFFANGSSGRRDVQALDQRPDPSTEAEQLFRDIFHGDGGGDRVVYRRHRLPWLSGRNAPDDVEAGLRSVIGRLAAGDRLFLYVTAHGGSGDDDDEHNTTISCWGDRSISVRQLSRWLDEASPLAEVIFVMTQCYCGGFSDGMYVGGDGEDELAAATRVGFFAQQYDLPAAGCRADVSNDEEYSSYFWGAFLGQTREGAPLPDVDCNGDGVVSLAEAHTCAVLHCNSIDIPLRTSEAFLRRHSRIDGDHEESDQYGELSSLSGRLNEIAARARPDQRRVILGLAEQLNLSPNADVREVFDAYSDAQGTFRQVRSGRRGWGRRSYRSFRRRLREAVVEQWPELQDVERADKSPLIQQRPEEFVAGVKSLEAYERYLRVRDGRREQQENSLNAELRQVKFRRLIHALEVVVLVDNLPRTADRELLNRYDRMLAAEESSLKPSPGARVYSF